LAGDSTCHKKDSENSETSENSESSGKSKKSGNCDELSNDLVLQNLMDAFGDEGTKKLNYQEFIGLLKALNNEILVQQFKVGEGGGEERGGDWREKRERG
jgi:hypothetical protein